MEEKSAISFKKNTVSLIRIFLISAIALLFLAAAILIPVFAWLYNARDVAAYAPISSPEALYIGTGNGDDIRYLYFTGLDIVGEKNYKDYIICVSGEGIGEYKLQLGHTTNNQFTYTLFEATDALSNETGAIGYISPLDGRTYYYKVKNVENDEVEVPLTSLNKAAGDEILANSDKHADTYGDYANVNKYAEPIYWQSDERASGITPVNQSFINYYVLRIGWENNVVAGNRETDVICIVATSQY